MVQPTFPEGLEPPVAVCWCKIDTEDGAKLAIKIGKTALGPLHDAHGKGFRAQWNVKPG